MIKLEKDTPVLTLWLGIMRLAVPLILSMTGFMLMSLVDAIFLSWHSAEALTAVVPAGMAVGLVLSLFQGMVGYSSTFVAHYVGAGREDRAFSAVWQSVYLAIISSIIVMFLGFYAKPFFNWVGHDPAVRQLEVKYFAISCWGALAPLCGNALSGYFAGRGKTLTIMFVHFLAFICNAVFDYLLIFGKLGFPEMGITGAAIATVIAQTISAIILMALFLGADNGYGVAWDDKAFEHKVFKKLVKFGFPNGIRYTFDMLVWTFFLFFIGRIGNAELTASGIAFRVNGFAFFPIIGLGHAVGILVGQSQGRRDSGSSTRVTKNGLILSQFWMITAAIIFLLFPEQIYNIFGGNIKSNPDFDQVIVFGKTLLRFLALYSLLDAFNIIFSRSLQAAGDTQWIMVASFVAYFFFLVALLIADAQKMNVNSYWIIGTVFVVSLAFMWIHRFSQGK
ncbi:MAG: MATE family efflux transporter, partial [Lentisphaerae bacterium]|nr:MATE family efflux transporter [Lentisphaerota bacterium]